MEKSTIETIVLIYSTVIATLAFLWNIIDTINKNRRRLNIKYSITGYTENKFSWFGLKSWSSSTSANSNYIQIEITNVSNSIILIYEPPVIFTETIKYFKTALISKNINSHTLDFKLAYPIRLQSGEKVVLRNSEMELESWFKFRIQLLDSFGKTYKSGEFVKSIN